MRKAKVSELKSRLSSYLAEVRAGDSLIVCDRATPIARLIPFEEETEGFKIREASRPIGELTEVRPVRPKKRLDIDKMLRESRGEK